LERRVLNQATAILSVTPELIDKYKQDHPKINKDKFHLIYNSPNKKLNFNDVFRAEGIKENTQFHIGYSGSFYYTPDTSLKEKIKKPHRFLQYQKKIYQFLFSNQLLINEFVCLIVNLNKTHSG
jgi:hypothetical protein